LEERGGREKLSKLKSAKKSLPRKKNRESINKKNNNGKKKILSREIGKGPKKTGK